MSAANSVIDQDQRLQAINPIDSFCVSAPAGSGKTELLIQRYLGLLARVERPEQVLAITFTRKAAAEMRERVLSALHAARDETPCESEHQLLTRDLARAALAADSRGNWRLLRNVTRLNIKTIDSFCLSLTRQMPVLSSFGGQVPPQEDARLLYAEAVEELFALLETRHTVAADLRALLAHYDNDWPRLQKLLIDMLMRRQQWRMYLGVHHAPDESEAYLTRVVEQLVRDELHSLNAELAPYHAELLQLMQFAARNLDQPQPECFPGSTASDLPAWRALRQMLQTNAGSWRKSVNKNDGFPADKNPEPVQRKEDVLRLLSELADKAGLEARLAAVAALPEIGAQSNSWRLVLHLSRLLPVLAAQLLLVFRQRGVVDYNQIAEAALSALGEEQAPTELALRLDYTIEHILVDEFQDTSINQFELLAKLTCGWAEHNTANPDAPRTMLIVGDAMQSIYGFRDANVGLFLKAREEGISGIRLEPLELRCNFRSQAGIVDWVNSTFADAFPAMDDIASARVSYRAATAVRGPGGSPAVTLDAFCGDNAPAAEVAYICDAIARCVTAGEHNIAVLGRTRAHLHPINRRLRELGVRCQAQELASLAGSAVVMDLMSLCRALANDADRLAWLSLLRAPWCGLQLADLMTVARLDDDSPYAAVRLSLATPELQARLSDDGRDRLAPLLRAISRAREKRDRLSLRVWIEQTWCDLGGPQSADDELALLDAESFFRLLEQAESDGVGLDVEWLQRQLETRFMSGGDSDCPVQLLTLHKAKGLEFSRVFIPRLHGRPRSDSRDLLLWDEQSSASGERVFLLAASDHSERDAPTLYNYLKRQRAAKSRDEATRLLYVGATRAIRHLHLSASMQRDDSEIGLKAPTETALLSTIWPTFAAQMTVHECSTPASDAGGSVRLLMRLANASLPPRQPGTAGDALPADNFPERPDNHFERSLGTTVHLMLEQLAQRRVLPTEVSQTDMARWRDALRQTGLSGAVLEAGLARVASAAAHALAPGSAGRWILDSNHAEAHSEWALTVAGREGSQDIVIDRTFIDAASGERWIIDYKTSLPVAGESLAAFTSRETRHYREQLSRYRDALACLGTQPVRCALYFTCLPHFHVLTEADLDLPTPPGSP